MVVFGDDPDDKCVADGRKQKKRHVTRDESHIARLSEHKHAAGEVPEDLLNNGKIEVGGLIDARKIEKRHRAEERGRLMLVHDPDAESDC